MKNWDWKVREYSGDTFMLETVHQGDHSKDVEVEVALELGRRVEVTNLHTGEITKLTPPR
jgi:hypothetical protein